MRVGERVRELPGDFECLAWGEAPSLAKIAREIRPPHVRHDDAGALLEAERVEDGDDVRVIELSGDARLSFEALEILRVVRERALEDLDRHFPVKSLVAGEIDVPH